MGRPGAPGREVVAAAGRAAVGGVPLGSREGRALDALQRREALSDKEVEQLYGIKAGTLRNWRS